MNAVQSSHPPFPIHSPKRLRGAAGRHHHRSAGARARGVCGGGAFGCRPLLAEPPSFLPAHPRGKQPLFKWRPPGSPAPAGGGARTRTLRHTASAHTHTRTRTHTHAHPAPLHALAHASSHVLAAASPAGLSHPITKAVCRPEAYPLLKVPEKTRLTNPNGSFTPMQLCMPLCNPAQKQLCHPQADRRNSCNGLLHKGQIETERDTRKLNGKLLLMWSSLAWHCKPLGRPTTSHQSRRERLQSQAASLLAAGAGKGRADARGRGCVRRPGGRRGMAPRRPVRGGGPSSGALSGRGPPA